MGTHLQSALATRWTFRYEKLHVNIAPWITSLNLNLIVLAGSVLLSRPSENVFFSSYIFLPTDLL